MAEEGELLPYGFPEIWESVYAKFRVFFDSAEEFSDLAEQILQAAQHKALETHEKAVFALARLTVIGMTELLVLASNGCGQGAMKIARGMFESALYAEYLRQYPEEVEDYLDFSIIVNWKRYQWKLENSPETVKQESPEAVRQLKENFERVKNRFGGENRLRNQWSKKRIAKMAENVGRKRQYELPYGIACSIHHSSFEGLLSYFEGEGEEMSFGAPPSTAWVGLAILFGHTSVMQALETLNRSCNLGLDGKIATAGKKFQDVWTAIQAKP